MKTLWVQAFSLLLVVLAGAAAGQKTELVDRIVAVVDEDPILESDLDRVVGLGLVDRGADEAEGEYRRRVLDQVIEEKLRFHEIDRFGFSQVSLSDVDVAFEKVRSHFQDDEMFSERLDALGITRQELRQLVARQLMVLTYVDERLGARVFVSGDDIQRYYDQTLVPELRARRERVPGFAAVREQIRGVLKEQRLNEEIARWTEELRLEADIEDYFEERKTEEPSLVLGADGN